MRVGSNGKALFSVAGLFIILILFALANPVVIIDTGHRGIRVKFGEVVGEPLTEGLHFRTPFVDHIVELDTRIKRNDDKQVTYTQDVQKVNVAYVVNYNLKRTAAGQVFKDVGVQWESKILIPALVGVTKEIIGKWDAVDLVGNRDKAAFEITEQLQSNLDKRGVTVSNFEITGLKFDVEFENAVEAKVTAVQRAEEAKNRTIQITEEAKQKVIAAKAESEAMRIKTTALAQSPALIQYEAVQKWDGKLPVNWYGGSVLPFVMVK